MFSAKNIEIPEGWSQVAADVLAQKYFRKAGVPKVLKKVYEEGVPVFLQRSTEDKEALEKLSQKKDIRAKLQRCRFLIDWLAHGPIGAGRETTLIAKKTQKFIMMK